MRLLIDFAHPTGGPTCRRVYSNPAQVLVAHSVAEVRGVLATVDAATSRQGLHAAGFLSYEAACAFDPAYIVREGNRLPLAWFGLFADYATEAAPGNIASPPATPPDWSTDLPRAEHDRAIACIREAIAEGRTYQVNLTTRLRSTFAGDAELWYETLRRAQGSGYHAFLDLDDFAILSVSPELFFARRGDTIVTRPMKGTRARGRELEEDLQIAEELLHSAKDRAENLMIVDLLRNDLGRIAETGTVQANELFRLERYPTVWQLTSTIRARVPRTIGIEQIMTALFPCGSVTGAPKISTMKLIAALERSPREVYCGAIGVVEPGGDCTFSVPIRTAWLDRGSGAVEYGVGSGVTWDSTASGEYDELLAKAAVLSGPPPSFALLETLLLEQGRYHRLNRHLERMRNSAAYFGRAFRELEVRYALEQLAAQQPSGSWRVRLLLSEAGVRTEVHPLEPQPTSPMLFALARTPIDASDRFLQHKTTHRVVYERAAADHPEAFDVLLWNQRGELTEFTRGNLVLEIDGQRLTPCRTSGLLAGTYRAELLEANTIAEAVLLVTDLARASRVWLINSVRGWVECTLLPAVDRAFRVTNQQAALL